jgi:hypothetical protein
LKTSVTPSLKSLSLDHIAELAAAIRTENPALSPQQAVVKAVATPEGKQAYAYIRQPGSHLPLMETLAAMAKGQVWLENPPLRDRIEAERATPASLAKADAAHDLYLARRRSGLERLTKGGSGPRGCRVEDAPTSGTKRPADVLANLSDSIYAQIKLDAVSANPAMSPEKAVATYLTTSAGEVAHARWAAARFQEGA